MLKLLRQELPAQQSVTGLRPPDDEEIRSLERAGNSSPSWNGVRISPRTDLTRIRGCRLLPPVTLDLESGELDVDGEGFQSGLEGCVLSDCTVIGLVRLTDVGLLRGVTVLGPWAVVRCGTVRARKGDAFGIGHPLQLGVETGQRSLPLIPTLDPETAHHLTSGTGLDGPGGAETLTRAVLSALSSIDPVVGPGCLLRDTPAITGCLLTGCVTVDAAAAVRDSFILGAEDGRTRVSDGALVRSSALQWGALVDSMAVVQGSIVGECSTVERHAKLTNSLLGPDSCLAEGEITACLAGPFTAMHHQSLLIAARWPLGQGNVGYGANVGSNHTSRAPDQELECGQGVFFGLGCSVKFPCSLRQAPFTVIATGVTTLPQRLEMPFSLVCPPTRGYSGVSPALNELRPGWVLDRNLYSLWRSMRKYRRRRRAVHTGSVQPVLCRRNAMLVENALTVLEGLSGDGPWTDIPAIGKNVLTGEARSRGIEAYGLFLAWYALDSFLRSLDRLQDPGAALDSMPSHARSVLTGRAGCAGAGPAARRYLELADDLMRRIRSSRERDMARGSRIIHDYRLLHAGSDAVLEDAQAVLEEGRSLVLNHFPQLS